MKKRKTIFKIILAGVVIFFSLLIIFLTAEVILRFNTKYALAAFQLSQTDLWRIRKNLHHKKVNVEKTSFELTTCNEGFRGPMPEEKKDGIKRILVLGDSYTAGLDFPYEQIFTTKLQDLLNSDSSLHQKFELINTGVPAWGIDQEWQYFANEGIKIHPDYVLLMASPNDIREAYCKKFVTVGDHSSLIVHKPNFILKKRIGWYLSSRSSVFQYLQDKVFKSNYGTIFDAFELYPVNFGKEDKTDWDRPLYLKTPFKEVQDARHLYELILGNIQSECKKQNISFGICLNAMQCNTDSIYDRDSSCDSHIVSNFIRDLTASRGIPFMDLTIQSLSLSNPHELYIPHDSHYSSKGHAFAGEQLYKFLKNQFKN